MPLPSSPRPPRDPSPSAGAVFTVQVLPSTRVATVVVTGELDREAAPVLSSCIGGQLRRGAGDLVLDLSAVTFVDAAGLRVVAETERRCRRRAGRLVLRVGDHHTVVRALTITGLITLADLDGLAG